MMIKYGLQPSGSLRGSEGCFMRKKLGAGSEEGEEGGRAGGRGGGLQWSIGTRTRPTGSLPCHTHTCGSIPKRRRTRTPQPPGTTAPTARTTGRQRAPLPLLARRRARRLRSVARASSSSCYGRVAQRAPVLAPLSLAVAGTAHRVNGTQWLVTALVSSQMTCGGKSL